MAFGKLFKTIMEIEAQLNLSRGATSEYAKTKIPSELHVGCIKTTLVGDGVMIV